ncbi:MAG: type II toxin-antitoxin system RelE/ParE family toxin [Bacteroidota bacterium]
MAFLPEYFEAAEADIEEALDWYMEKNQDVASRFYDVFLDLEERILENPFQFPIVFDNLRKARFLNSFPYSIIFFIEKNVVFIFHDKRDPQVWKDRV